jgi:site-specific recombinase XerD
MAAQRAWTFTTEDESQMLKASYPLTEAMADFRRDAPIRETTLRGYTISLRLFVEWLQAKTRTQPTLAHLTYENASAFGANFRPKDKHAPRYTERNKLVALKALAKWLAERHLYFEARGDQRLSILRDLRLPPVPQLGRKPFSDREVKAILGAVAKIATYPMRERAVLTLQMSAPMRPDEVRRLALRDFEPHERERRGHIRIRGSKTEAGSDRVIPLDDEAESALHSYLRFERPAWVGDGPKDLAGEEPLFLNRDGRGFTEFSWNSRNQILRRRLEQSGVRDFVQYRSRGYAAKRLQKRRVPLQVIMQIGGWKREAMPTRYIGRYDEDELKDFPTANLRDVLAR